MKLTFIKHFYTMESIHDKANKQNKIETLLANNYPFITSHKTHSLVNKTPKQMEFN